MPDNMVALFVPPADRAKVLDILPESLRQYAQSPENLHLTLWYWQGETLSNLREELVRMNEPERFHLPMTGKVQGWGVFEQGDQRVLYASYDHAALPYLRSEITSRFVTPDSSSEHGFVPHITLAYLPDDAVIPDIKFEAFDLTFDRLYLATDNVVVSSGPVEGVQEIGQDTLETQFSLAKSFTELPNGDLEITVTGVPFYGPEFLGGRDFSKEYFDKSTDIGGLPEVLSYFHHGKDPLFGKELLGKAQYLGMDEEEGHFYKIIVSKAAKYRNAIKALSQQGWLGASSTPFQRTAEKDADGLWKRWHVVEVCLTYQPDNPEADVKSVIEKSIGETMDPQNPNSAPGENDAPVTETPATETPTNNDTPVVDVVAEVEKALNEGEEQAPSLEAVLEKALAAFEARLDAKIKEALAPTEKSIKDINVALPLLAKKIGQNVRTEMTNELQKSGTERAVEQTLRTAPRRAIVDPNLPPDAPGNN